MLTKSKEKRINEIFQINNDIISKNSTVRVENKEKK